MKKTLSRISYFVAALSITLLFTFPAYQSGFAAVLNENVKSPFTVIYEKVSPAVVLIEVETEQQQGQNAIPNPFERFFNLPSPQQQVPQKQSGIGSGVIISRDGHIITNNHVVENATKLNVKLSNTEQYKAEVVGRDPQTDLAVIKLDLDGKQLPPEYVAELGDSDTIKPGDYAIAIGNPVGLERTITVGIISAIGRYDLMVQGAQMQFQNFIQTDAQINPGNSGGALVDINGKVVGINNMYEAHYAAIGFAIPVNIVKKVSAQLMKSGVVKRGFVGFREPRDGSSSSITKDIQQAMNLPTTQGFLVSDVMDGSPAQKAGIVHGDVVTSLDGTPLKDFHDFMMKISERAPGDVIKLEVFHEGKTKSIGLTLADRDDFQNLADSGGNGAGSWLGINVVDLSSQIAQSHGLGDIKSGVVIASIDNDSPAADTNLKEGDVILEIQSKQIDNTQTFEKVKNELKDSKKPILIFRLRKMSNGDATRGYVAVKNQ
jgi:serine protease Do